MAVWKKIKKKKSKDKCQLYILDHWRWKNIYANLLLLKKWVFRNTDIKEQLKSSHSYDRIQSELKLAGLTLPKHSNINQNTLTCFLRHLSLLGTWFKNKAALENNKKNINFKMSIGLTVTPKAILFSLIAVFHQQFNQIASILRIPLVVLLLYCFKLEKQWDQYCSISVRNFYHPSITFFNSSIS